MTSYIDLGLPSGTLWATMNVGAKSIVDCGKHFSHREALNCDATLPTKEQFQELVENTTYVWVVNYNNCGVNGELFIGKNGNEVFFPAAGHCLNGSAYLIGSVGYYWTSSLYYYKSYANFLYFHSCGVNWQGYCDLRNAFTLRAVKNKNR